MEQIIYIFIHVVYYYLFAAQILMLLRAVCSIFIMDDDNPIANFLYYATEPLVYPLRLLFEKLGVLEGFMLDIPFIATMFVIIMLQSALPAVTL